jgi:hypothetical protein
VQLASLAAKPTTKSTATATTDANSVCATNITSTARVPLAFATCWYAQS